MIFDEFELPRDNGAVDMKDSARLAGLMALFEHKNSPDLTKYLIGDKLIPVRHPIYFAIKDKSSMVSRDQIIPFAAGLWRQDTSYRINPNYKIPNGDWLSPSHKDHLRRCCGEKDTWLGRIWLWFDVLWACYVRPMDENNQILTMLVLAGKPYLQFYLKNCKDWKKCIRVYWAGWRSEPEFAEFIIDKLEAMNV